MKLFLILIVASLVSCNQKILLGQTDQRENVLSEWFIGFNPTNNSSVLSNSGDEWCQRIKEDHQGNLLLACFTNGDLFESKTNAGSNGAVVKLNPNGELIWATQIGAQSPGALNTYTGSSHFFKMDIDSQGSSYFCGDVNGAFIESHGGGADLFYGKVDTNGNISWLKQLGADTMSAFSSSSSKAYANASANENRCDIAVLNDKVVVYGTTNGQLSDLNSSSNTDVFFLNIDKDTGDLVDIKQLGENWATDYIASGGFASASTNLNQNGFSIAKDASNNVYASLVTADSMSELVGVVDAAYVKLDSSLNLSYIKQIGQTTTANYAAIPGNFSSSSSNSAENFPLISIEQDGKAYLRMITKSDLGDTWTTGSDNFALLE